MTKQKIINNLFYKNNSSLDYYNSPKQTQNNYLKNYPSYRKDSNYNENYNSNNINHNNYSSKEYYSKNEFNSYNNSNNSNCNKNNWRKASYNNVNSYTKYNKGFSNTNKPFKRDRFNSEGNSFQPKDNRFNSPYSNSSNSPVHTFYNSNDYQKEVNIKQLDVKYPLESKISNKFS